VGTRTQLNGLYWAPDGLGDCTCDGGLPCTDAGIIDDPACLGTTNVIDGTTASLPPTPTSAGRTESTETIKMEGQNFNLGILWEPDPQWTIGAMYRSEVDLDLQRDVTYKSTGQRTLKFSYDEKLRLPAAYGVGVAYRYSDEFTVAFDATRTEYNRARIELDDGTEISPINGLPMDEADINPTETYRLGSERLVVQPKYVVALRSGVFYDPEPAQGHKDDYYGAAVGAGLVYEPVVIDLAYWYRWGDDVVLYTEYDAGSGDYNEVKGDITEQMLMLSVVTHF
jgi:long-subunit fatty acid transport protein